LFDENLAVRLVELLRAESPGSVHVRHAIGPAATDEQICEYAPMMEKPCFVDA